MPFFSPNWKEKVTNIQLAVSTIAIVISLGYTGYNTTTGFFMTRADADEIISKFKQQMEAASYERLLNKQMTIDVQIYQMEKSGDHESIDPTIKRLYKNALKQRVVVDKKLEAIEMKKFNGEIHSSE